MDATTFEDVEYSLAKWIGSILPELDNALVMIGSDDWKPGTRETIMRAVAMEMLDLFNAQTYACEDESLLRVRATQHLARYAICEARARVLSGA